MPEEPKNKQDNPLSDEELEKIEEEAMAEMQDEDWNEDTVADAQSITSEGADPTVAGDSASEEMATAMEHPRNRKSSQRSSPSD
jgi:hypothetical protein